MMSLRLRRPRRPVRSFPAPRPIEVSTMTSDLPQAAERSIIEDPHAWWLDGELTIRDAYQAGCDQLNARTEHSRRDIKQLLTSIAEQLAEQQPAAFAAFSEQLEQRLDPAKLPIEAPALPAALQLEIEPTPVEALATLDIMETLQEAASDTVSGEVGSITGELRRIADDRLVRPEEPSEFFGDAPEPAPIDAEHEPEPDPEPSPQAQPIPEPEPAAAVIPDPTWMPSSTGSKLHLAREFEPMRALCGSPIAPLGAGPAGAGAAGAEHCERCQSSTRPERDTGPIDAIDV